MTDTRAALAHTLELLREEEAEERRLYTERVQLTPLADRVAQGVCFYPAAVVHEGFGPGETPLVELKLHSAKAHVRQSLFQPGQVVSVFANDPAARKLPSTTGVVAGISEGRLKVALHAEESPEWLYDPHPLGVDPFYDDRSYREMEYALRAVAAADGDRLSELREILLGDVPAQFYPVPTTSTAAHLNASQRAAVDFALGARDVAFIHGPPGTGKTTTMVAAIQHAVRAETQVLACAPSNTAVDLLAEKLTDAGLRVVRLGHPVRVSEQLQALTLDAQLDSHPSAGEVKRLQRQSEQARTQALKHKRSYNAQERRLRQQRLHEARSMRRDAERLERFILADVLGRAQVVLTTLTGAASALLRDMHWFTVFIDEAAQALEPACWIALRKADRVVFAGDPYQLPPTVKSKPAGEAGLLVSLAEKALLRQASLKVDISRMLQVQYRMHRDIMHFSNQVFYGGQLVADASVATRRMPWPEADGPVVWIDTAGCGFDEETNPQTLSTANPGEADLLLRYVADLLAPHTQHPAFHGIRIGLVAPYSEQVALLRQRAAAHPVLGRLPHSQLAIRTVDGFQGQERDVIAISLVRSNVEAVIGFLADTRRMNVAMTRARCKLVIVGDSATLGSHRFYAQLIEYLQQTGAYRSAWELVPQST